MAINKFRGEYSFLSNMYPIMVRIDGESYPSAEHAFQALKSLNKDVRLAISVCRSPSEAKYAGKHIELRDDWDSVKVDIMYKILLAKFKNPELAKKLKDTGSEELIEGNTWNDKFWGVCNGDGQNMLGKLLMKVREELS